MKEVQLQGIGKRPATESKKQKKGSENNESKF